MEKMIIDLLNGLYDFSHTMTFVNGCVIFYAVLTVFALTRKQKGIP